MVRSGVICLMSLIIILNMTGNAFNLQETDNKRNGDNLIAAVTASKNQSSFNPRAFLSGSGRVHLVFQHEVTEGDMAMIKYYHTYELENGKWAQPKKIIPEAEVILAIKPKEDGLIIYYFIYHPEERGFYKIKYNEVTNQWSEPVLLFDDPQILAYLNLPEIEHHWHAHSFYLIDEKSFFIVWSFEFYQDSNFTHEDEQKYIISKVEKNSIIESQTLHLPNEGYEHKRLMALIKTGDEFSLYTRDFGEKSVLSNDSPWSNWQNTGISEQPIGYDKLLIANQYLFGYKQTWNSIKKEYRPPIFAVVDLAVETPTVTIIDLSLGAYPLTIDVELFIKSQAEIIFIVSVITNSSIELWEFDYLNNKTNLVSSLEYIPTAPYDWEPFINDLLQDGSNWRVFWDQKIAKYLTEVFTVNYHLPDQEWSSVTQITDTSNITDDYKGMGILSFSFLNEVFGIIIIGYFLKKRNSKSC